MLGFMKIITTAIQVVHWMAGMVTIVTFNGSQIEVKLAMLVSDAIDDKNFTD